MAQPFDFEQYGPSIGLSSGFSGPLGLFGPRPPSLMAPSQDQYDQYLSPDEQQAKMALGRRLFQPSPSRGAALGRGIGDAFAGMSAADPMASNFTQFLQTLAGTRMAASRRDAMQHQDFQDMLALGNAGRQRMIDAMRMQEMQETGEARLLGRYTDPKYMTLRQLEAEGIRMGDPKFADRYNEVYNTIIEKTAPAPKTAHEFLARADAAYIANPTAQTKADRDRALEMVSQEAQALDTKMDKPNYEQEVVRTAAQMFPNDPMKRIKWAGEQLAAYHEHLKQADPDRALRLLQTMNAATERNMNSYSLALTNANTAEERVKAGWEKNMPASVARWRNMPGVGRGQTGDAEAPAPPMNPVTGEPNWEAVSEDRLKDPKLSDEERSLVLNWKQVNTDYWNWKYSRQRAIDQARTPWEEKANIAKAAADMSAGITGSRFGSKAFKAPTPEETAKNATPYSQPKPAAATPAPAPAPKAQGARPVLKDSDYEDALKRAGGNDLEALKLLIKEGKLGKF